jgi:hypothetical protein
MEWRSEAVASGESCAAGLVTGLALLGSTRYTGTVKASEPIERCVICKAGAATAAVAWDCLPVSAFGNPAKAEVKVATIGLNPALNEFGSGARFRKPRKSRLPILEDYGKDRREDLGDPDVEDARNRRSNYFADTERVWHGYFEPLECLLGRVDALWSYAIGTAIHFDLVGCATNERWGALSREYVKVLVTNCREHFLRTLVSLPNGTVLLLNGRSVWELFDSTGVRLQRDCEAELISLQTNLVGWRGSVILEDREFRFRGWSTQVGRLKPVERVELAYWVRRSL